MKSRDELIYWPIKASANGLKTADDQDQCIDQKRAGKHVEFVKKNVKNVKKHHQMLNINSNFMN